MNALFSPTTAGSRLVISRRPHGGLAPILAGLLALCVVPAPLAGAATAAARKPALPPVADFQQLSGSHPGSCAAPVAPGLAALGEPSVRHCAWSQRIEMLYWETMPDTPNSCLPTPAIAWHRLGSGVRAVLPPWSGAWSGQWMQVQTEGLVQSGAVWRRPDGQWSAVLWRWRPSDRIPTRNWQAGHWNTVAQALRAIGAGNAAPPRPPLMVAWLDATNGKPRALDGDAWRWASDGSCLVMRSAGLGQARLHLPHSRDDARLEQRSAMQVLLARRFPDAEWLRPFSLVEPAIAGDRTGAKFLAVWREGTAMHGQLWVPLRGEGGIVRARISSDLPASPAGATSATIATGSRADEPAKQRAALIERELTRLAHAWEARHE